MGFSVDLLALVWIGAIYLVCRLAAFNNFGDDE